MEMIFQVSLVLNKIVLEWSIYDYSSILKSWFYKHIFINKMNRLKGLHQTFLKSLIMFTLFLREFLKNVGPLQNNVKSKTAMDAVQEVLSATKAANDSRDTENEPEVGLVTTQESLGGYKLSPLAIKQMLELICDESVSCLPKFLDSCYYEKSFTENAVKFYVFSF